MEDFCPVYSKVAMLLNIILVALVVCQGYVHVHGCCCDYRKQANTAVFESLCCSTANSGKTVITATKTGEIVTLVCPDFIPKLCSLHGFASCSDVHKSTSNATSGYYGIMLANGSHVSTYCDLEGDNCDGEGGWTRIAYVNMTTQNAQCPTGLSSIQYDNIDWPLCNKPSPELAGCASAHFTTGGVRYNKVCGRLRGYQFCSPDGLHPTAGISTDDINGVYLDGASITYGSPRKHIWSFAGGLTEGTETGWYCPCNQGSTRTTPSFVGQDYYCESAVNPGGSWATVLYPDDPLWDGANCNGPEAGCCTNEKMPWFTKSLVGYTSDDVELRLCSSQSAPDVEGTPLEVIEILVK